MARDRERRKPHGGRSGAKARRRKWVSVGCGALSALGLAVLIAIQFVPVRSGRHPHAAAPHGGEVVSLDRGALHYHAELVVEPSGVVRLYPFSASLTDPLALDAQHIGARAGPVGSGEDYELLFRPDPGAGTSDGRTTAFIGRLPASAVAAKLRVRVPALLIRGESFAVEAVVTAGRSDEAVAAAYAVEQKRIYLTPGGKYTESDIAAEGRTTASAKYPGSHPRHADLARAGDRVCPVTGLKAAEEVVWRVSGGAYRFCCQPCIDEFVLLAKERPGEVREPGAYVKRQ